MFPACVTSARYVPCWKTWESIRRSPMKRTATASRSRLASCLNPIAPYELVKQMRASVLVLGRWSHASGTHASHCQAGRAIGVRPINLHLKGLEKLGATISFDHGYVNAEANGLRGAEFYFDTVSVTGTENLMMAAALAEGITVLENAAREPEIEDLANLLNKMGASIEGAGTDNIRIRGVSRLHGAEHSIIPDRIEAGTFMAAAAITGGDLALHRCETNHLGAVIAKFKEVGVTFDSQPYRGRRAHAQSQPPRPSQRLRCDHPGVSGLPHRYAGSVHGAHDAGPGALRDNRDDL